METVKISKTLRSRLPVYLDYLRSLSGENDNISATTIANALGFGEVQVRKDLAKVSVEGRCRTGRSRDQLIRDIEQCLEERTTVCSIIVGMDKLGQDLLERHTTEESGVHVMACFDLRPTRKRIRNGKPIYSIKRLESFCKCYDVHVGIIAVPAENAQGVCDGLIACGVQSIWNYAPVQLKVPAHVTLQNESAVAFSGVQ